MKKGLLSAAACLLTMIGNAQTVQWAKNYPALGEFTWPKYLETDGSNELVFGEYFTAYSSSGLFLQKMDGGGTVLWSKTMNSPNAQVAGWAPPTVGGLAVNASGNIYIGGNFGDTLDVEGTSYPINGSENIFLAKYASDGSMSWIQTYDHARLSSIFSDGTNTYFLVTFTGSVNIFGQSYTSVGSSDLLILELGAADNLMWSKQLHGKISGVKFVKAASGNMFLAGYFSDEALSYDSYSYAWSGGFNDYFLLKMDPAGNQLYYNLLWASQQQSAHDMVVTADEKVFVGGQSCWTDGCMGIIKTFDAAGSLLADQGFSGSTCSYGCGFDANDLVVTDASGVWMMGAEQNTLNYGIPEDDWHNISLSKFDFSGNIISKDTFRVDAADGIEVSKGIAADNSGALYMTAPFRGTAAFGSYTLTNSGTDQEFILIKMGFLATAVDDKEDPYLVKISPNPSSGRFELDYRNNGKSTYQLKVRDVLGQLVLDEQKEISGSDRPVIDLSGQPKGIYFLEIGGGSERKVEKLILN
ncbi:MAG: T9SS type A sorting domain-containing protein [Bacteroidia bacterium]